MANSNFVTNTAVFTPFTYEELARPVIEQTQLQMAIEDAYSQLGQNAGAVAALLNPQNDARAYNQYTAYMQALNQQAEDIARSGLNNRSRSALSSLNARYATDIIPIQKAYENRAAEIKRAQELSDKDPTRLLSYDPSQRSVDDYLLNPSMSFESKSGAILANEVSQQVQPIAKALREYGNTGRLDAYTKTWIEDHGMKLSDVEYAIAHPDEPGVLQNIVERVIATSGIDNWGDREASIMARYYAQQGLYDAIGQTNVHTYSDVANTEALKGFYATRRARLSAGGSDDASRGSVWRQHRYVTPGDKKTVKIQGDMQALNEMANNGKLDFDIIDRIARDNGMKFEDIVSKDGKINMDVYSTLMDKMQKTSLLNTESELYLADYGLTSDVLNRALRARVSKGLSSGFREYSNGRLKDKDAKDKDVSKYLNNDMSIIFSPEEGYFAVGKNKDGETKRFLMNPELISGFRRVREDGTYDMLNTLETMRHDYLNAVNSGQYDDAAEIHEDIGRFMYSALNSMALVQGKSSTKVAQE